MCKIWRWCKLILQWIEWKFTSVWQWVIEYNYLENRDSGYWNIVIGEPEERLLGSLQSAYWLIGANDNECYWDVCKRKRTITWIKRFSWQASEECQRNQCLSYVA